MTRHLPPEGWRETALNILAIFEERQAYWRRAEEKKLSAGAR